MDHKQPPQFSTQPIAWFRAHLNIFLLVLFVLASASILAWAEYDSARNEEVGEQSASQARCMESSPDCEAPASEDAEAAHPSLQYDLAAKYGLTFKYPEGYEVLTGKSGRPAFDGGVYYSVGLPGDKWSFGVDLKPNTSNMTTDQAYQENYDYWAESAMGPSDFKLSDFKAREVEVSGFPARQLTIDRFGDVGSVMVSLATDKFIYLFTGSPDSLTYDFLSSIKIEDGIYDVSFLSES